MLQNIKVDIIYYKTSTDFEMEFNLCGCCRMRLLTDKTGDSKTLIHSMARAVSRSKVIFLIGSLFDEEGILKLASAAIGSELTVVDGSTYGIKEEENIEIIKGSTPLVTPEGYFGGCIIESGPQTMIILSENKNVRKSIMQNLIHPYIEELATAQPKKQEEIEEDDDCIIEAEIDAVLPLPEAPEIPEEPELPESPEEPKEQIPEEISQETEPELEPDKTKDILTDDDIVLSGDMTFEEDDTPIAAPSNVEEIELFTQPNVMYASESKKYNSAYSSVSYDDDTLVVSNEEDEFDLPINPITEDDDSYERKPITLNLPILILAIILLLSIAVLCYCIFYVPSKEGISAASYLKETFNTLFG